MLCQMTCCKACISKGFGSYNRSLLKVDLCGHFDSVISFWKVSTVSFTRKYYFGITERGNTPQQTLLPPR